MTGNRLDTDDLKRLQVIYLVISFYLFIRKEISYFKLVKNDGVTLKSLLFKLKHKDLILDVLRRERQSINTEEYLDVTPDEAPLLSDILNEGVKITFQMYDSDVMEFKLELEKLKKYYYRKYAEMSLSMKLSPFISSNYDPTIKYTQSIETKGTNQFMSLYTHFDYWDSITFNANGSINPHNFDHAIKNYHQILKEMIIDLIRISVAPTNDIDS
jgi:hypothetical protein